MATRNAATDAPAAPFIPHRGTASRLSAMFSAAATRTIQTCEMVRWANWKAASK